MREPLRFKTVILGAGAAGMMCAQEAGPDTLVVDHARNPGEKIRISGGGRCNFTNQYTGPDNFLGENAHFHKSALTRYTPWDFVALLDGHGIAWHEKTLGQLFCDGRATQIVSLLVRKLQDAGATLWLSTTLRDIDHAGSAFRLRLEKEGHVSDVTCRNLVLATGGKSIPKMGATGLSYDIARRFGHRVTETRPALVPFTFDKGRFAELAGIAAPATVRVAHQAFDEAILFTHRGLSGPAVLQISSYWREGDAIEVTLLPDAAAALRAARRDEGRKTVGTWLSQHMPARLARHLAGDEAGSRLCDLSDRRLAALEARLERWRLTPGGTEGYRTAEVTLGGIATDEIDSRTMESRRLPGLFAIGEAVDVTGWLGGYNFQWAWASGHAAGTALAAR